MARFLTTKAIEAEVDRVIASARKRLLVLSPYLRLSHITFDRLVEAGARGVEIDYVYGQKALKYEQERLLSQVSRLQVSFLENLHAKAYLNDDAAVITSMNLYEADKTANREMGVLFTATEDADAYRDAFAEALSIVRSARAEHRPAPSRESGYCLRCATPIPFDPGTPLCKPCYAVWAEYRNPEYPERACHRCGRDSDVSMRRPLCRPCWDSVLG